MPTAPLFGMSTTVRPGHVPETRVSGSCRVITLAPKRIEEKEELDTYLLTEHYPPRVGPLSFFLCTPPEATETVVGGLRDD